MDIALCYGWIDGQVKSLDQDAYLHKFTPRRPRSIWSKINRLKVEKLIEAGRMQRTAVGRKPTIVRPPPGCPMTLNSANRYAILWRLQTAKKPETRQTRLEKILGMLERGEKFH